MTLLDVQDLSVTYPGRRRGLRRPPPIRAVTDLSFSIGVGETVALVGESGSGKTTSARAIAGLVDVAGGSITFDGTEVATMGTARRPAELLRSMQYVFQNPDASLNPKRRVGYSLGRALEHFFGLGGEDRERRIGELLESVQLDPAYRHRFPGQLSGGERQRVAIARALAAEPKLIICDEIVTALDVSVQASILDLLQEVQQSLGVSYLFIAHDLAVVRWLADRVIVLFGGAAMEYGSVDDVFSAPFHPYTESLLRSVPSPIPDGSLLAASLEGGAGDPGATGCPFHTRCDYALESVCNAQPAPLRVHGDGAKTLWCHIEPAELARHQAARRTG